MQRKQDSSAPSVDGAQLTHDLAASVGFLGGPAENIDASLARAQAGAPAVHEGERTYRVRTGPGGTEVTVAPPGGAGSAETTVGGEEGDAGGGTKTGGAETTTAGTFCECIPTSAAIKNVKNYSSGKLYGHEFDFVVGLKYQKLEGASAHKDATLEWWEKTDRPPAWQTVITKNTWNDMFALYPTSPTFDGWTKSRTKPCEGTETASIHDPPAASVDMPARTLEFNLKVIGGGQTKGATATQVLEPDGKGGIKTQTFG